MKTKLIYPEGGMKIVLMNSPERNHSFHGAVTDVQMWSRELSETELREHGSLAACTYNYSSFDIGISCENYFQSENSKQADISSCHAEINCRLPRENGFETKSEISVKSNTASWFGATYQESK